MKRIHLLPKGIILPAILLLGIPVFAQNISKITGGDFTYQKPHSNEESEEQGERSAAILDSWQIMDAVASKTGASKDNMSVFSKFYADTLYNDRVAFVNSIGTTVKNNSDIEKYAGSMIEKYVTLYQKLQWMEKEFPTSVKEYSSPRHAQLSTSSAPCNNIGFEAGNLNGWSAYCAYSNSTAAKMSYGATTGGPCGAVTESGFDNVTNTYKANSTYQVKIMSGKGVDPIDPAIPVVAPGGGNYSVRLGDSSVGGSRVGIIKTSFKVTASNAELTYMYAVLCAWPGVKYPHTFGQQPHFQFYITDSANTLDTVHCGQYLVLSAPNLPGYTGINYYIPSQGWYDTIECKPWTSVYVSLQSEIGKSVTMTALVSDCYPTAIGPHFCYVYFDAVCAPLSVVTQSVTVCSNKTTLTAPLGPSYQWSGPGIMGSTTSQTITVDITGTYEVKITNPDGCGDSLKTVVTLNPAVSAKDSIINGECKTGGKAFIMPSGGNSPYTFAWSNGVNTPSDTGLSAGNYYVLITDHNGCKDSVAFIISNPSSLKTNDSTVEGGCKTGGKAFVTPSGGNAPYTFAWSNGVTTTTPGDTGLSVGNYSVLITDRNGCTTTASFTISNPSAPAVSVNAPVKPCPSDTSTVLLTANASPSGVKYKWNTGDTASSIRVPAVDKTYTVTVTNSNGCVATANGSVVIDNPAYINACCSETIVPGSSTILVAHGSKSYTWQPLADVTCLTPSCDSVSVKPGQNTTYTVTGTDSIKCEISRTLTINVEIPCSNFTVPNVFTPNYPGRGGPLGIEVDNVFYIDAQNVQDWSILIYDRWGKEMFKSSNPTQYWDGKTEGGSLASEGVYYYIISASCRGTTYKKDGFVQLIR